MNVRKRQVICDLSKANITLQAGAMQWMAGNVNATTGLKGVGDFFGKAVRGKVTGESAVKPEYTGNGVLVLEPTYRHILLIDLADWNGSIVLDDGLFWRVTPSSSRRRSCARISPLRWQAGKVCLISHCRERRALSGISFTKGGIDRGHLAGRCAEGGRQHGDCLERHP